MEKIGSLISAGEIESGMGNGMGAWRIGQEVESGMGGGGENEQRVSSGMRAWEKTVIRKK